jgi:WD40 repeat protein
MAPANPETLKTVKEISRREIVFALARLPGTSRVLFGGSDFKVYDLDLGGEKPEPAELGAHQSYVTGLAPTAGAQGVSGGYDGRLIWWDTEARAQVRAVEAHGKWVRGVEATPDGATIASVADDMVCRLWDAASGRLLHELRGHAETTPHHYPSMLFACATSPDGLLVATGDKVGHVVVWEVASGKQVASLEAPEMYTWDPSQRRHSIGGIRSLAFSPDGKLLAVGGIGKIGNIDHLEGKALVQVFDWRTGERTHHFPSDQFKGLVERLAFHPRGDWLLAAGGANDGFLMFFDLVAGKVIAQEKAAMHVHDVALDANGTTIIAAGHGKITMIEMGS